MRVQRERTRVGHLAKQAVADAAGELLSLGDLISDSFLLIQLLSQHLQLGECQLQGEPVHVALRSIFKHVLEKRGDSP